MNEITIKNLDGSTITIKTDCNSVNVNGQMFQFSDTIQPQKPLKCRIPFNKDNAIPIIKAIRTATRFDLKQSKDIAESSTSFFILPHLYEEFHRFVTENKITFEMLDS